MDTFVPVQTCVAILSRGLLRAATGRVRGGVLMALAGTVGGLACVPASGQTIPWLAAVDGLWDNPSNWSTSNVPDASGESAELGLGSAYTVTIGAEQSVTIAGLLVPNALASLRLEGPGGASLPTELAIGSGGVSNSGLVRLMAGAGSADARLVFADSCTISGTGEVRLEEAGDAGILVATGVTVTHSAGHRITGAGSIGVAGSGQFVNSGLVDANSAGGVLSLGGFTNHALVRASGGGTLRPSLVTQSASGVVRADGGMVQLSGGTISGGAVESINAGTVEVLIHSSGTLDGVTLSGECLVHGPTSSSFTTTLNINAGGLVNNGAVRLMAGTASTDARMVFFQSATVSGSGVLSLEEAGDTALLVVNGFTATNGSGHTITGVGTISGASGAQFVNKGTVAPGMPIGTMSATLFSQDAAGVLEIELAGDADAQRDRLANTGSGSLALGGTLKVRFRDGYVMPPCGEHVAISGAYTGEFSTKDFPVMPYGKMSVLYDAGAVRIAYFPADYDGSGFVDLDDFSVFVADFEAGIDAADFDNSGFVDLDDFVVFVGAFEAGC